MVNGVDYRIPMSVKGLDLSGLASNYMAGQQNKRQNELLELTKKQKAQEMQHLDDENRFKSILKFGLQIKPYLDAGDIGGAQRVYSQRIQDIKSRGGNPSDSMELAPYLMSGDTEGASALVGSVINAGREMGYLGGSGGTPSGIQEFNYLSQDLNEDERARAMRIKLGLDPRAMGNSSITIAQSPGLTGLVADSEATIAGAKSGASETAKLEAKTALEPQLVQKLEEIKAQVSSQKDLAKEDRSNARALAAYEQGMTSLGKALGATETGRVVGMLPAITSNAQIAEGAIAVMAPILKSIFRTAGEGTFTDKDQEMLITMLPTRKDTPEAAQAKLEMVDMVVRTKLGSSDSVEPEENIDDLVNMYGD
jgi:hypothetical protein